MKHAIKYEYNGSVEKMTTKLSKRIMALAITTITVIGMPTVGASAKWRQNNNGWWNLNENGYSVGWEQIGDNWFYFDRDGYMKTGWVKDGDKWYFLNSNGYMKTGWIKDGDKWYFLNLNGDMAHDIIINGYKLSSDGTWINDETNINTISTTGAAVVVPIDNINTTSTTSAAVMIPRDNFNDDGSCSKKDNKEKIEKLLDKQDKKNDRRVEKQEHKLWKFFNR